MPHADPMSHHLVTMAHHNAWSNHRLLNACAQLSPEQFAAPRTGFFPSILATLNHIVTVDWFYVDALEREARGEPPHPDYVSSFFTPAEPFDACAPLQQAQRAVDGRLLGYCQALRDDELAREVTILRRDGPQRETRLRLLSHLFQHQTHHRGQVHAMLSGTPVAPPQLDEFFCAMDAPLREKEFAELGFSEAALWGPPG
ncbi:DinB family protein [Comamonadaceae bacterium G21597-S1]|nr:DinB family protein [Comamonadaceae bacterium G21597-S1]